MMYFGSLYFKEYGLPVADPEGFLLVTAFETYLFNFHGDFLEKSGKINKL